MSQVPSAIAFLSAEQASYERIQTLFSQASQQQFPVEWLNTHHIDLDKELTNYEIFLGDAPLEYLLDHLIVLQEKVCFWLTDSEITQAELLNQRIADCFLWSEFNADLFSHCLRRHRLAKPASASNPLEEFDGDRFQTLIENIPGAVYRCLHNEEWQGIYISDAIADIVGYPAADFSPSGDRTFDSIVHPDDLDLFHQTTDTHIANRTPFAFEYRLVHRDGSIHWVEERGQGVFDQDGNFLWIDGVIVEITSQKKYLTQLAHQQLAYYEKTPAMLHVLNRSDEIVAVSDRWLEVMDYAREEVIGRKSTEFLTSRSQEFAKKMLPLFYQQGQINDVEYQFIKKNGEVIDISLSGRIDNSGTEPLFLAVLIDVTIRNRLNAQLSIYQTRLQELVSQRTEALAVSETKLRSIFDCAPIGIAETDLAGQFRFVNQRFTEMTGVEAIDLLSRSVFDITYDQDHAMSAEILAKFRNEEINAFSCEKRYLRSDGSWFWGSLSIASVKNFRGEIEYLIATIEDIHQRKSTEESLRESEYRLTAAQKLARLGVWEWDLVTQAMYWSPECFEIFGYQPHSFEPSIELAMTVVHPEDRLRINAFIENILSGGEYDDYVNYRIVTPAGETKFLKDYIETIRDESGSVIFMRGATQDITAEMSTIAALEKSEARLSRAQAIAHIGVWEWDVVADRTHWSAEMYELFEMPVGNVQPNSEVFLSLLHPDDRPKAIAAIEQLHREKTLPESVEYRIVTPTGKTKIIKEFYEAVCDDAGEIVTVLGTTTDVTEFRNAITALEESEARLSRAQAIANIGVWEWNIAARKIFWSPECFEICGYEPKSFEPTVEISIATLHPDDRSYIQKLGRSIFTGKVEHDTFVEQVRIITTAGAIRTTRNYVEISRTAQGKVAAIRGAIQDVTADVMTVQALEKSESRLAEAQKIAGLGYWESNFKANTLYWSDATYDIFGVDPQTFQPTYQAFIEAVHPEDREFVEDTARHLLLGDNDSTNPIEFRVTTPDGLVKIVRTYLEPLKDDLNEVVGIKGTNHDITKDKQIIAALEQSEARLARAQAIAKVGYWEWDIRQNVTICSTEINEIFDRAPNSPAPDYDEYLTYIHPDDRERVDHHVQQFLAGEVDGQLEHRLITENGVVKHILDQMELKRDADGEIIYLICSTQDVTEFHKKTVALRESEARLAKAQKIAKVGVWEWDLKSNILTWSDEFYLLFELEPQSVEPNFDLFISMVEPGDRPRIFEAIEVLKAGEKVYGFEYRANTSKGQKIVVEHVDAIRDQAGEVVSFSGTLQDVTAFRQVNVALQKSEARFRSIFDQAALGIVQVSLDGKFVGVNQAFCDLVGYTQAELLDITWLEISHPLDTPNCLRGIDQILMGNVESTVTEKRYRHKQGHYVWTKVVISCIRNAEREPTYVLSLVEDITVYKKTSDELAKTQNRYGDLVNGVHAIMYQYSTVKGGIFYSQRVKDILGYDIDYLLTHNTFWTESIHPSDRPQVEEIIANLKDGKPLTVEYRIQDINGQWHWFSDKSFSIEEVNENEYVVSGLALDITQQKEVNDALRRRLRLETVLAEISNLIIVNNKLDFPLVLGLLGKTLGACWMSVLYCQPQKTKLEKLGYWSRDCESPIEESWSTIEISRFPHWLDKWQTQEKIVILDVAKIPEAGRLERKALIRLGIRALLLVPIQDDEGKAWGYLACSSDKAQPPSWSQEDTDLLAIAGDLIYHHLMRQQARKNLEQAKDKAEAANFAKSQFLTNMSHELRTPLNAILGFTQLMKRSPTFPEEHRQRLEIVAASGQQLLVFVNDILELARFEEGKASLNLGLFNLHALLDDLQKRFQSSGDRHNLNISIQRSDDLPRYITADQTKLHSVLSHLLSNATKFTYQGEVKLMAEVTSYQPLTIRFSVTDTGIGIEPSEQVQLFQDFVKLEAGDRHGQGSGLGLALSQKFVKLMGSEIKVSSKPNVGSCFSFELQWNIHDAHRLGLESKAADEPTESTLFLTPSDLQVLPSQWRQKFYTAACSARIKALESLIAEISAEQRVIAQKLQVLVDKLDFDTLVNISQPPESPKI